MYFQNYRLSKTCLKNSLERAVSEPPSTDNMLMGAKHFWNLNEWIFIIFLDHSERKWLGKDIPYWNL